MNYRYLSHYQLVVSLKDAMVRLLSRFHNEYGIVHKDIKPRNFVRCRDGKLYFCDELLDATRKGERQEPATANQRCRRPLINGFVLDLISSLF